MIRRILVPIAGDQQRDAAIDCAEALARKHGAAIHLLGVVDVPGIERSSAGAGPGASHYAQEMRERHLDEARTTLVCAQKNLAAALDQSGIDYECSMAAGPVHEVIARHSRRADLVVVGRESNFQFETADHPGDTLLKLLRCTLRLTLVVPQGFSGEIERVVIAHDLSLTSSRVLYTMVHVDPFPGARYVVVHADPDGVIAEEELADIVEYLASHGKLAELVVRSLPPSEAVLDVVAQQQAQALVLGAYDVTKVRQMLLGSTAATILEKSTVPLLFGV